MTDIESTATLVPNGVDSMKLCPRCEQLDLTVDKFIIGSTSAPVTRAEQRYKINNQDAAKFRIKTGKISEVFARLHELRSNSDTCRFCELVYKAIERYSHGSPSESITSSLTWEVDGRQIASGSGHRYVNSTRRIRLSWSEPTGNSQEVYLVFVAPTDPLRPNSDAQSKWEQDTHFLGREFGDHKEKQALIKSWLDMCVKDHGEVCLDIHGTERDFMELIKETYFGVIDVADMQLKALPITDGKPERYVALSYVWGTRPYDDLPYTTTRLNVMTHILHGGLETAWDKLPRTLQDAILLVSRLGERYLWIDALCIVQDSLNSWQLNAGAMHLVYGNAYFTICAADGDSSSGLRAVQPILRSMHSEGLGERLASMNLNSAQTAENDESRPTSAECAPGVRLMVTRSLEAVVSDSLWNERAWTFQERILSRRCLVFAEGRVYFQCRSTGISQDIYTDGKGSGWSLDRTNSPLRTLREFRQRPLWFYMKYVKMYTGRQLTKPLDILAAFEGISWVLERYLQAPSLFGIPTSHFDLALLWAPLNALHRRRPGSVAKSKHSCTQDVMGNCTCRVESDAFGGKEFPSWAWSGWMGGTVEYQPMMIEGCLLNVREWLKFHTWIQWHVRDEKGHIRPLCEISAYNPREKGAHRPVLTRSYSRPGSFEDEDRWKGYPGNDRRRKATAASTRTRFKDTRSHDAEIDTEKRRDHSPNRGPRYTYSPPPPPRPQGRLVRIRRPSPRPSRYAEPYVDDYEDSAEDSDNDVRRGGVSPPRYTNGHPSPPVREYERVSNTRYLSHKSPLPSYLERRDREAAVSPPRSIERRPSAPVRDYERVSNENYLRRRSRRSPSPPPVNDHKRPDVNNDMGRVEVTDYTGSRSYRVVAPKGDRDELERTREEVEELRRKVRGVALRESDSRSPSPPSNQHDEDDYGRPIRAEIPKETQPFHAILPDSPFGVIRENYFSQDPSEVQHMPVLQFWTWRTELHIGIRELSAGTTVGLPGPGLLQCDIVDNEGDWCGSIVLAEQWIRERQGSLFQFIAISDAKAFAKEECPVWTYYIPKERDESDWDLYYVLLLERNVERGVWERAGLGKVFQAAFKEKTWDEIKLG